MRNLLKKHRSAQLHSSESGGGAHKAHMLTGHRAGRLRVLHYVLMGLGLFLLACPGPVEPPPKKEPKPEACKMVEPPAVKVDPKADKFALTMFHYNIEYVVGGLNGTKDYKSFCGIDCDELDNDAVEDWIVRESFKPVVDFYYKYPKWKVNFEMQGYMLEILAKRFPEQLKKIREMAQRGQMEISSFHYSDQLFLAYPREDLERSIKLTKEIFKKHCVPLSGVVFNQEGQAGEGRQKVLVNQGYKIGVFPKNLFKYVRGEKTQPWPYYKQFGGHLIMGSMGVDPASKIQLHWLFFDDGELLSVQDKLNPYFAYLAKHDPKRMEDYKKKIEDFEKRGYKIAHISEYVEHLKAKKIEAKPAPKLLDGTWQPKTTASIHRWMGGQGLYTTEQDNNVRAGNYRARTVLKAAEVLYEVWKKQNKADDAIEKTLAETWKKMYRSQVSDSSGVNPWIGETMWSLRLNKEVTEQAQKIIDDIKKRLGMSFVKIDLKDKSASKLDKQPDELDGWVEDKLPIKDFKVNATNRTHKLTVWKHKTDKDRYRIRIEFTESSDKKSRNLKVTFPRLEERIVYSPGLMEDEIVDYAITDFIYQTKEVFLPLSNGLIGLGQEWFAIKHTRTNHLAVRLPSEQKTVEFIDNTQPVDQKTVWFFDLIKASKKDALAAAMRLNITPVVYK